MMVMVVVIVVAMVMMVMAVVMVVQSIIQKCNTQYKDNKNNLKLDENTIFPEEMWELKKPSVVFFILV